MTVLGVAAVDENSSPTWLQTGGFAAEEKPLDRSYLVTTAWKYLESVEKKKMSMGDVAR